MDDRNMTARAFHASKYTEALQYKERVGGLMRRFIHPTMGVMYEVRFIPQEVTNAQPQDSNHTP